MEDADILNDFILHGPLKYRPMARNTSYSIPMNYYVIPGPDFLAISGEVDFNFSCQGKSHIFYFTIHFEYPDSISDNNNAKNKRIGDIIRKWCYDII